MAVRRRLQNSTIFALQKFGFEQASPTTPADSHGQKHPLIDPQGAAIITLAVSESEIN